MSRPRSDPSAAALWQPSVAAWGGVPVDVVYVTYWSLNDPLCLSQSLPVVRALAEDGYRLALVTFEQEPWCLAAQEQDVTRASLLSEGIRWIPLRYHKRPRLLATAFDIVHGVWACARAGTKGAVRVFHGRGTVATAVAYLSARLTGARFFNDADGPLSDEYADAGVWQPGSVLHRLTRGAERHLLRAGDTVAVLTTHRRAQVWALATRDATVLPCGVDTTLFRFRAGERRALRDALGLTGTVLVYAGKSGGWYLTDAMLDFAAATVGVLADSSLLVLTNGDPRPFTEGAARRGIRCVVTSATRSEMPGLLSTADAGLSFVLSAPSKASSSPVKNGEYLACGLPVVSTAGIGDYSDLIARHRVGVVAERLDTEGLREASLALAVLLKDPDLQSRCRNMALAEVSLTNVVLPGYRRLYRTLLRTALTRSGPVALA